MPFVVRLHASNTIPKWNCKCGRDAHNFHNSMCWERANMILWKPLEQNKVLSGRLASSALQTHRFQWEQAHFAKFRIEWAKTNGYSSLELVFQELTNGFGKNILYIYINVSQLFENNCPPVERTKMLHKHSSPSIRRSYLLDRIYHVHFNAPTEKTENSCAPCF